MYAFSYSNPRTLDEVSAASGQFLAGGQSLIPSMKLRLAQPGAIVDLNQVDGLAGIRVSGDQVEIGAMTRHADVAASREVQARHSGAGRAGRRHWRSPGARARHDGRLAGQQRPRGLLSQCGAGSGRHRVTSGARLRPTTSSRACTPRHWKRAS
jgi:carbon-monoxide dehydrogenase medium subunit